MSKSINSYILSKKNRKFDNSNLIHYQNILERINNLELPVYCYQHILYSWGKKIDMSDSYVYMRDILEIHYQDHNIGHDRHN